MSDLEGINHVTFLTADLDRLAEFYEEVFGARKVMELPIPGGGRHALLEVGSGATLHPFELPHIETPPAQPMFSRGRTDHFALNADADTFEVLRSRLLDRGDTDGQVTDFGVLRVLTFTDPDGHSVELAHWVGGNDPGSIDMSAATDDELVSRQRGES